MRRTLKVLGLFGVAAAAGAAAARRMLPESGPAIAEADVHDHASVSQELRQALNRFEERFGA